MIWSEILSVITFYEYFTVVSLVNARGDVFEGPRPDCIRQLLNKYEFSATPIVPENFLAWHPSLLDVGMLTNGCRKRNKSTYKSSPLIKKCYWRRKKL